MKRLNQKINREYAERLGSLKRIVSAETNLVSQGLLDTDDGYCTLTPKGQKEAGARWRRLSNEDKFLFALHVMNMDLPHYEEET